MLSCHIFAVLSSHQPLAWGGAGLSQERGDTNPESTCMPKLPCSGEKSLLFLPSSPCKQPHSASQL